MSEKRLSTAKNAMYNTVGTVFYCLCQWLTTSLLVVRLSPEGLSYENEGMIQLAISITNIFHAISTYNMRTYQISDVNDKYSAGDYIGARIVTTGLSVLLCIAYSAVLGYPLRMLLCIIAYMIFKLNESLSDVYHGIDQKNMRMDYVGISYILRGTVMTVSFTAALVLLKDILAAVSLMAVLTLSVVFFYDIPRASRFGSVKPEFNKKKIFQMLLICLPAVVASSCFAATATLPRQFLEGLLGEEALGYYGAVATPVVIVQVLATSIFNPLLTEFSLFFNNGDIKAMKKLILKTVGLVAIIAAVFFLGFRLFGDFAYTLVFGPDIKPYTYLMYGILLTSIGYTLCWLASCLLIIIRRLKAFMVISIAVLAVSACISVPFINLFDLNGVSLATTLSYGLFVLISMLVVLKNLNRRD